MSKSVSNPTANNQLATMNDVAPITHSERFTQAVLKEFAAKAGGVQLTPFQKKLIQNYFIKLDMTLADNEQKRLAKSEKYRDALEFTWNNVNMKQLALDVVSFSSIGLDPLQKNHINLIPYKNNKTAKFDIGFIIGYNGSELKARKYGYDVPDNVIIELVRENDTFKPIKKDKDHASESYTFDIGTGFDRGAIIGGFYFFDYKDAPEKNKLAILTLADIEKRKPKYASAEFWGGKKDKWEGGQKVGTEDLEGWYDEMCWKTIKRAAYDSIAIDSEKIDEHLVRMMATPTEAEAGNSTAALTASHEITTNGNKQAMTFEDAELVPPETNKIEQPVKEKDECPI